MAENRAYAGIEWRPDSAKAEIDRLSAANARLQAEIAERFQTGPEAAVERALFNAILRQVPEHVYAKDAAGRFVAANDAMARDNGLARGTDLIGKTEYDLSPAEVAHRIFGAEQEIIISGKTMIDIEEERVDSSGRAQWFLTTRLPMRDNLGEIVGLIGLARNVTDHVRARQEWTAEQALLRAMVDQVPDNLWVKDLDSRFVIANKATALRMGKRQVSDLIGRSDLELCPPEIAHQYLADEQRVIRNAEPMIDKEEYVIGAVDEKKWISTTKVPLRNETNEVIGIVGISRDITDRRLAENQVHHMAHHDALTGLPNRVLLMDRLTQALLQAGPIGGGVTVLFIDLDNFKPVNDSFGHTAGDLLLKTVAERMVRCVRAIDTVVRLGGDEFVVMLIDTGDSPNAASAIVEKLRAAIREPIAIGGQLCHVTPSIGLATFPENGTDADTLLMNADAAMYRAKERGPDNVQSYLVEINVAAREKRLLHESLRTGLARQEFALVYQPQVDLRSGRIFAVEALARWLHPELGTIMPDKFIPMAEESGLIVQLGEWVLREACRQNKAWQDAGIAPITVCVNVSARQFREKEWVDQVTRALNDTGLDAKYLELELTESLLMQNVDQAIATMRELQAIGVRLSIDDFGTGYSSLSALKSFPVARLKIDQSFVRNLPYDVNERNIATAVISLGQKLNMRVIAEGVETDAQLAFLAENNCDEIQGYHFSRPIEPGAVTEMLRQQPTSV